MHTVKVGKRVNAVDLYDEIVAAVPELAPTPTGPDGRLEAKLVIEQVDPGTVLVHLPDDADTTEVERAVKAHRRKAERTVDPVADAMKVVKKKADQGDGLAQAVLTILEQRG